MSVYRHGIELFSNLQRMLAQSGLSQEEANKVELTLTFPDPISRDTFTNALRQSAYSLAPRRSAASVGNYSGVWMGLTYHLIVRE